MFRLIGQIIIWLLTWLYYVLIICFVGAMLGVISHLLVGGLVVEEPDFGYLASFGFSNGLRYGGVWAGGFAIVLCVIRARKEYLQKRGESEHSEA
jgi:hypothetical protein